MDDNPGTMPPLDDLPPHISFETGLAGALETAAIPSVRPSSPTLRGTVTETLATLREMALMPRDIIPVVPQAVTHADDVVVLVHGIFASAGVFRPMKQDLLRETKAKVASFTHAPGPTIPRLARSLARLVERIGFGPRIHLVGHSLGGLVARWYVQELGGHRRVAQTISLGSPFGGTERARPFRFFVGNDLHTTSPTLARLRARAKEHGVPHLSIVADADAVVVPCKSAVFPSGDVHVLEGRGHNSLLFDPEAIRLVVDRVRKTPER